MGVGSVRKKEMRLEKVRRLLRKLRFTVLVLVRALYKRGGSRAKTQTVIHATVCFWPLQMFLHAESVQEHESGLRNTVLMLTSCHAVARIQRFSVFSATADRIRALFPFSGPNQYPCSPAKAQKTLPRKSETVISEAASMALVTSIFMAISIISATVNPSRVPFHDSRPIRHQ
jgi:hypothetical protein